MNGRVGKGGSVLLLVISALVMSCVLAAGAAPRVRQPTTIPSGRGVESGYAASRGGLPAIISQSRVQGCAMSNEQPSKDQATSSSASEPEVEKVPTRDGLAHVHVAEDGTLTLTKPDGTAVKKVRLSLAWPLRHRDRYIAVLDEKGHEELMASSLDDFATDCRELVKAEIERRYLDTEILSVLSLRVERQVSYWEVMTDRGRREFVVQGSETNPYRISESHWQIIDVAGNRYEIPDVNALDTTSQVLLSELLS